MATYNSTTGMFSVPDDIWEWDPSAAPKAKQAWYDDGDEAAYENDRKTNAKKTNAKKRQFIILFLETEQLAKSFIDIYGTQGSIEHTFSDYLSLKNEMNKVFQLSDDMNDELKFQYGNMTRT